MPTSPSPPSATANMHWMRGGCRGCGVVRVFEVGSCQCGYPSDPKRVGGGRATVAGLKRGLQRRRRAGFVRSAMYDGLGGNVDATFRPGMFRVDPQPDGSRCADAVGLFRGGIDGIVCAERRRRDQSPHQFVQALHQCGRPQTLHSRVREHHGRSYPRTEETAFGESRPCDQDVAPDGRDHSDECPRLREVDVLQRADDPAAMSPTDHHFCSGGLGGSLRGFSGLSSRPMWSSSALPRCWCC